MARGTWIRCDILDCKFCEYGGCTKLVIDIEFHKQDKQHEYAICKDYEKEADFEEI